MTQTRDDASPDRASMPAAGERAGHAAAPTGDAAAGFRHAPLRVRVYLTSVGLAAALLPLVVTGPGGAVTTSTCWATVAVLVLLSVVNVELGRALSGGLARTHQPHKALSAWSFACALLLPTPWLLAVVPLTYAHARWRGLRIPMWKWVGSGCYLILAGVGAAAVADLVGGGEDNWMAANGGRGVLAVLAAAATFLAIETLLFSGSALLGRAEDEVWLRATLTSPSFYATEACVLLIGGLVAAVWTGGAWFVLFSLPVYALAQRAALHEPLRERAEMAAELASRNEDLESANQFKIDLLSILGHELGNPLTVVQGYAELGSEALQAADIPKAQHALAVVDRGASDIRRVLHEILTLVKSDRGALVAYPERCLLADHLDAAVSTLPADQRPTVVCPPHLAALVQPGHLDQILANLLTNAAKYAGGATRVSARAAASGVIEIRVVDAGPGVPPELSEHLFERFSRHAETAQKVMGTGLGLFIARELARANSGDLAYHPGSPVGAEFRVLLPVAGPA